MPPKYNKPLTGKINYLAPSGETIETELFINRKDFERTVKSCVNCGEPISITVYVEKVEDKHFLKTLDPPPNCKIKPFGRSFQLSKNPTEIALNLEEYFFEIHENESDFSYSFYDFNFKELSHATYDKTNCTMFEAVENILQNDENFANALVVDHALFISAVEFTAEKEAEFRSETHFLSENAKSFAIYQLKDEAAATGLIFTSFEQLEKHDKQVLKENYELVYTDSLSYFDKLDSAEEIAVVLEKIYTKFNCNHPQNYTGHSISVSDIVAINDQGMLSSHYVDKIGFERLPNFFADVQLPQEMFRGTREEYREHLKQQHLAANELYKASVKTEKPKTILQKLKQAKQKKPKTKKSKEMER